MTLNFDCKREREKEERKDLKVDVDIVEEEKVFLHEGYKNFP